MSTSTTRSSFSLPAPQASFSAMVASPAFIVLDTGVHVVEFGGSVDATALLDFVDAGHDLLLATDSDASDELRELAADLGVEFDTKGSAIVDHFNRHDQQSAVITHQALESNIIFGSSHKHVGHLMRTSLLRLPSPVLLPSKHLSVCLAS